MSMRRGHLGWGAASATAAVLLVLGGATALQAQGGTPVQKESVRGTRTTPPAAPAPTLPKVPGSELDRVVAIVNDDLVLDSDVAEEQRFEQLQPIGLTGAGAFDRERAIERLIDRDLILQQAKMEPGLEIADADLDKEIGGLRQQLPGCKAGGCATDAGWKRYLAAHGFTPDGFRDRWRVRMQVLAFIDERFRAGNRASQAEIKSYYEKTMLPEYARQHVKAPPLETVSAGIADVLLQQEVTSLLSDWLKQLRAQGSVAVLHPGEPAP